jgi:hypothetical protein
MPKKNIRKQQKLEAQNFDQQNFEPQIPLTTQVTPQMGEYDEYSRLNGDGEQVRSYTGMGIFNPALVLEEGNFNLVGMNDGVLQAGISADDGKLLAGGGAVTLGDDGITILTDSQAGLLDQQKIIFKDRTTLAYLLWLYAYEFLVGADNYRQLNFWLYKDNAGVNNMNLGIKYPQIGTGFPLITIIEQIADEVSKYSRMRIYVQGERSTHDSMRSTIDLTVDEPTDTPKIVTTVSDGVDSNATTITKDVTTFQKSIQIIPASGSTTEGILSWNTDRDTLNLSQTGTNLQLGQEVHFYVINQTGSTITNGTVVQYDGALGASGIIKVKKAVSDGSISAIQIMGIATQDIANGATGKVTFFGEVHDFDTSGYTAGTILYLNPSVAGGLTSTEPAAPNLRYAIAMTIDSKHNGTLIVRAIYSMALHELNDVTLTSPANGQLLTHDGTKWINKRITPTVSSETSSATPTINVNSVDAHSITALAANITSMTTNLSGSPSNFQKLTIRIKDNGTARTIAWGTSYASRGATLPTTTVISKVTTVGLIYNSVTSTWDCVAVAQEA